MTTTDVRSLCPTNPQHTRLALHPSLSFPPPRRGPFHHSLPPLSVPALPCNNSLRSTAVSSSRVPSCTLRCTTHPHVHQQGLRPPRRCATRVQIVSRRGLNSGEVDATVLGGLAVELERKKDRGAQVRELRLSYFFPVIPDRRIHRRPKT